MDINSHSQNAALHGEKRYTRMRLGGCKDDHEDDDGNERGDSGDDQSLLFLGPPRPEVPLTFPVSQKSKIL